MPAFTHSPASLSWSGVDPGGSGIANYDVQSRDGAGVWTDWQLASTASGAAFNGMPGHTYSFRSRARDNVSNLEAYPGDDGDAYTTFYTWMVEGMVWDNSGIPVAGATITGTPGVFLAGLSGEQGGYALYSSMTPVDPRQVRASKAGYGALPAARMAGSEDVVFDAILPPADNLIVNPGFESGLFSPGWAAGGAQSVISGGHSGFFVASLGSLAEPPGTPGEPRATL